MKSKFYSIYETHANYTYQVLSVTSSSCTILHLFLHTSDKQPQNSEQGIVSFIISSQIEFSSFMMRDISPFQKRLKCDFRKFLHRVDITQHVPSVVEMACRKEIMHRLFTSVSQIPLHGQQVHKEATRTVV